MKTNRLNEISELLNTIGNQPAEIKQIIHKALSSEFAQGIQQQQVLPKRTYKRRYGIRQTPLPTLTTRSSILKADKIIKYLETSAGMASIKELSGGTGINPNTIYNLLLAMLKKYPHLKRTKEGNKWLYFYERI